MSASGRAILPLSVAAQAALDDAVGVLAADNDVIAIDLDEGRGIALTRRARREVLDVAVPEALFTRFSDEGAFTETHFARALPSGDVVSAAILGDTRRIHIEKNPNVPILMLSLFEEGLVDEESALRLMGAIQSGRHVVISGPCAGGRRRLAVALATECAPYLSVARLDARGPSSFLVVPLGDTLMARVQSAAHVGVELLLAVDIDSAPLLELLRSEPRVVVVASVSSPRAPLLDGVDAERATVGFSASGAARVETVRVPKEAAPVVESAARSAPLVGRSSTPPQTITAPYEPLPALAPGPPSGWASRGHDSEPGWELQSIDEPSPFDDVMKSVRERKTYTPRPPPLHPAASKLRGSGGLTLEPPLGDDATPLPPDVDEDPR
jgi:hypothetical protein